MYRHLAGRQFKFKFYFMTRYCIIASMRLIRPLLKVSYELKAQKGPRTFSIQIFQINLVTPKFAILETCILLGKLRFRTGKEDYYWISLLPPGRQND